MKIKTKMGDTAVSEIVGAVFLLAISVFSVIYMNVLSDDVSNPESHATIVGKMEKQVMQYLNIDVEKKLALIQKS